MSCKSFEGKAVIVTGSNSGIGEAIALLFARKGAMVTLCGRDEKRLEETLNKCIEVSGGASGRFVCVAGDVTEEKARKEIVAKTVETFGKLDVLVPNAGVCPSSSIVTDTEEMFDLIINTNLKAVYFLIQEALPYLEKTKGNVVCVSSSLTSHPLPVMEIYQMSKAGIDHLVRTLALSQAPKGIRVNGVNPTLVVSTRLFGRDETNRRMLSSLDEDFGKKHPLHGRASTVEEQAEVVVFLAGGGAGFVTGQSVTVDGGLCLGKRP
ncbi:3-oxoacyl-[acyl-carrier-protein] reductase FabG [Aplysia californica]|uniref:3-oxoacyl-[acyl-carrier-protein] reductase FabG n=1 Tax=Aplysia californica TaxID=6500 RepID=A0ABM0K3I6_APLCA|nr:3-oxoacyl-[acyl-carrier-protein] reductase FabG [Aplysia californica]